MNANLQGTCISCMRQNTSTGFPVQGDRAAITAALHLKAGLPLEDAAATAALLNEERGETPGVVLLCPWCAEHTGVKLQPVIDLRLRNN